MESREDPVKRSVSKRTDDRYTDGSDRKRSTVFDAPHHHALMLLWSAHESKSSLNFNKILLIKRYFVYKRPINLILFLAPALMTRSMMIMVLLLGQSEASKITPAQSGWNTQANAVITAARLAPNARPLMIIQLCPANALEATITSHRALSMITHRRPPANVMIINVRWRFATCQYLLVVSEQADLVARMFTRVMLVVL